MYERLKIENEVKDILNNNFEQNFLILNGINFGNITEFIIENEQLLKEFKENIENNNTLDNDLIIFNIIDTVLG